MTPSTPDTDHSRLLDRTRGWFQDTQALSESASQVGHKGLLASLAVGVVAGAAMGLSASLGLTPGIDARWAYGGMAGFAAALLLAWWRPRVAQSLQYLAVAAGWLGLVGGAWANGMPALAVFPGLLALIHLVMRPGAALALGLGALLLMVGLVVGRHGVADAALLLRLLIGAAASLVFWQLVSRFWRHWTRQVREMGIEMSVAVTQLDAQRAQALRAAREARQTDTATGLLNRQGFIAALAQALQPAADGAVPPAGLVLALRLLAWNDATTHRDPVTQEDLLQALVVRLREVTGERALLARSGPDSYLAWLPADGADADAALATWEARAAAMEPAITTGTVSAPTVPRMGISRAPADGANATELVAHAEMACMAAVRRRQAQPVRYSTALVTDAEHRDRTTRELMQALQQGGFELDYQPLVSTQDPALRKAEALIRWQHPVHGRIPPGAFIPLAEQTGLIIELTDWVLAEAAQQVRHWRATLHPGFQISVNMPPAYLALCVREPERLLQRLRALQLPAGALVLEITEGVMLEVTPELLQVIALLHGLGFEIALDDFGVGYSSFGQIDRLPLDVLKLDKSFVDDLAVRPERRAICAAMVTMAHALGFQVVAEGVETEEQRALLTAMGADYLQGFLYSRPLRPAQLEAWAAGR